MKLKRFFILLWSLVAAFPKGKVLSTPKNGLPSTTHDLLSRLLATVIDNVNNDWEDLGIPSLEPIKLDSYELLIPAGLIHLDLKLKNISMNGHGDYVLHESNLNVEKHIYDIDLEFPNLHIISEEYDLLGDVYTVIPIYGKGRAEFIIEEFRFRARLHLSQFDTSKAVRMSDFENAWFNIRNIKSNLSGVVGGGDVDAIVNALMEEVILNYVNRFNGAISHFVIQSIAALGSLEQKN